MPAPDTQFTELADAMERATSHVLLAELEADGLLRRDGARFRTTRRWQAAMARAAFRLWGSGDTGEDLRVPIASALVELYGDAPEERIIEYVEAVLPIEARELDPRPRS